MTPTDPTDPMDPADEIDPTDEVEVSGERAEGLSEETADASVGAATGPLAASPVSVPSRGIFSRLYHGETNLNIVGRWKVWFAVSGAFILIGLVALVGQGLNLGIDFTGGTVWEVRAGDADVADVETAVRDLGYSDVQVQEVTVAGGGGGGDSRVIRVETEATASPDRATTKALQGAVDDLDELAGTVKGESRTSLRAVAANLDGVKGPFRTAVPEELAALQDQIDGLRDALDAESGRTQAVADATTTMRTQVDALVAAEKAERERLGQAVSEVLAEQTGSKITTITVDTVGPSWGKQISEKARTALVVFLIAIGLYISLRFEFKMALATLVALVHDLLIVVGLYAVFQFPVTPATVIAVLTILGFSIYDGIVVFDRVDENTKLLGRKAKMTYSDMANLSLNEVLMRSLNTSITALLPILSVLVLGSLVLGASALEEFGLALFLGLLSGAYSSIFIATPMLALLKEREPRNRELRERLAAGGSVDDGAGAKAATASDQVVARPRKQGKTR